MHRTPTLSNYRKHTSNNPLQKLLIGRFYDEFLQMAGSIGPKTILDIGCGEGFTLQRLYAAHIGTSLEGLDVSPEAVREGKRLFPHLALSTGDIYDTQKKSRSYDLILCMEVLEHVNDPLRAFHELTRLTKRDLILSVPNEPWFMLANLLRAKNVSRLGNDVEHVNHWTVGGFLHFLASANVKVTLVRTPFPWTLVHAVIPG